MQNAYILTKVQLQGINDYALCDHSQSHLIYSLSKYTISKTLQPE